MNAFGLSPDQLKLQARARDLAAGPVTKRAAEVDRTEQYPWDNVELLKDARLIGMTIPEQYGGLGKGWLDAVLAIEALSAACAVTSRTFGDQGMALDTRIGISTGNVIGGSVGAGQRFSYTLLGDTVNLAARLEELNKQYGTRILVSQSTREACGDRFVFHGLGSVTVRGRSDAVAIFSVDPNGQGTSS